VKGSVGIASSGFSVLGPLPLTLILPHVDLFWTGILTVLINLITAGAFASIIIYAMELLPNRIGLIGGLFYGLNLYPRCSLS
jgi:MFS transporter, FSR family, fosmidomycin resistance protein